MSPTTLPVRLAAVALIALAACKHDTPGAPDANLPRPHARIVADDAGPPPPHDFGDDTYRIGLFTGEGTTRPGLSCDKPSPDVRACTGFLASAVDGARLDVKLEIPLQVGKPVPLVVLIHGYGASRSSYGGFTAALLGDGYAVLRYSTRGFGDSWGQVNLVDLHAEIADLRSMIAQVVDTKRYHIDGNAVAVAGGSYGGGHSWLAALEPTFTTPGGNVVHIRTIVPFATWSDLLYSLLPNGRERASLDGPGGVKLSYINGLYFTGIRDDPERPYPNYPEYFIAWHAWVNAQEPTEVDPVFRSIMDGLAGYRSVWWQQRFWDGVRARRIPIFMAQGFTDDLFPLPEAKRMLLALRTIDPAYPVAAYFGDIGHPRASNKPAEVDYVFNLIRAWLGYYLKGSGSAPQGVYAARTRPRGQPFDPADVVVVPTLDELATDVVSKSFAEPALLVNPLTDPAGGFFWDPLVMEAARELLPLPEPPQSPLVPGSLATYDVPVSELSEGAGALVVAGQPSVSLHLSSTSYRVQIDVRLLDVDAAGHKQLITRGTYTLESGTVGVPLGERDVVIATYGNLWRVEAGHTVRLELTNVDSPYITPSRVPSISMVTGVQLEIPVRR